MVDPLPDDADGDALRRLIATGSDISKEMQMDFAMDIPDPDSGFAFAPIAERLGFHTKLYQNGDDDRWTCNCSRIMVPSYAAMIEIQQTLEDAGRPYNATPDGWGSFGNADTNGGTQ